MYMQYFVSSLEEHVVVLINKILSQRLIGLIVKQCLCAWKDDIDILSERFEYNLEIILMDQNDSMMK